MMCHSIGLPPISTIGFGRSDVSSLSRVPDPPARMTTFTAGPRARRACGRGSSARSCEHPARTGGVPPAAASSIPGMATLIAPLPARFARLVKVEHTVFALPFAYVGALLAVDGVPSAHDLLWI